MKKASKIILIIILVVVVVGAISWFAFIKKPKQPEYTYITAEKSTLTQEVSITGKITPAETVDLAFEKSGKVSWAPVAVGDKIIVGQVLAALDDSELRAQLQQAEAKVENAQAQTSQYQAALEAEQAKLEELKQGSKQEDIQLSEIKVANAQKALGDAETNSENVQNKADTDLNNLYDGVEDILQDAYAKADDAVNKQTNDLFDSDTTDRPTLTFPTAPSQSKIDSEWQRVLSRDALAAFKSGIDALSQEHSALDEALSNAQNHLTVVRDFLNQLNESLDEAINTPQATINTYKGYVHTGRTNINTGLANINDQVQDIAAQGATNQQNISTAQSGVNDAENTLSTAQQELALKKTGATEEQIAAQEAKIKQAQANITASQAAIKQEAANVANIQAQLSKYTLISPISGIVTKQEAKKGEIITANTILVSIISESDFDIKANVPEIDIGKVKLNDTASLTLDAIGTETVFEAVVVDIEPGETIIEGVATYKVTLGFTEKDERIKPGMTADVNISTAKKENVISIPARAVITQNGRKFVRILHTSNGISTVEEKTVVTGLRGSDGNVEILNGLQQGDKVITLFER